MQTSHAVIGLLLPGQYLNYAMGMKICVLDRLLRNDPFLSCFLRIVI